MLIRWKSKDKNSNSSSSSKKKRKGREGGNIFIFFPQIKQQTGTKRKKHTQAQYGCDAHSHSAQRNGRSWHAGYVGNVGHAITIWNELQTRVYLLFILMGIGTGQTDICSHRWHSDRHEIEHLSNRRMNVGLRKWQFVRKLYGSHFELISNWKGIFDRPYHTHLYLYAMENIDLSAHSVWWNRFYLIQNANKVKLRHLISADDPCHWTEVVRNVFFVRCFFSHRCWYSTHASCGFR